MKRTNKFLALFSCVLLLASCKDDPEKQLERMQGEWVHVKGSPAFTLSGTPFREKAAHTMLPGKRISGGKFWKPPI